MTRLPREMLVPERGLLGGLPAALAERVVALGRTRRHPPGALIHAEGDPAPDLVLIRSGDVRLSRTDASGRLITLATLQPGDTFGLFTVLTQRPRAYDADAPGGAHLLALSARDLTRLLDEEPLIRTRVIALLSDRLARTLDALEDERRLPLKGRVAKRLLAGAGEDGTVQLTQENLAEELGVSRYAITLALRSLAQEGGLETGYGWIRVRRTGVLQKAATYSLRRTA